MSRKLNEGVMMDDVRFDSPHIFPAAVGGSIIQQSISRLACSDPFSGTNKGTPSLITIKTK